MRGPPGKLKPEDVRAIRAVYETVKGTRTPWRKPLARRYGLSPSYLPDIVHRKRYAWVS